MVRTFVDAVRQISREIFLGDYRADTASSGTVEAVNFGTSASLSQITDVFEAGTAVAHKE